ncbi:MAG: FAD-dependent oxidoreductase [bacterium]
MAEIESALISFKWIQWKFKSLKNIGFAGAEPELFMNADKFIEKYHIEPIAYGFSPLWAGAGYGYYSDVPALYVLKLMVPFVSNLSSSPDVLRRAPEGFQRLWEKVAEDLEDVRLNQTVEKVKRGDNESSISIEVTANGLTETFDRIIISCDLKEALKFIDASPEEQELFSQVQNNDFCIHILHADGIPYHDGTLLLLAENTMPETIGHVTAIISREDTPGVWTSYQIAPRGASADRSKV